MIDDLPPLREVIARHGLAARRELGQNFILDLNLTMRIALAGGPVASAHVVEIGPGPGGLTRALLAAGAASVTAVEADARCLPALAEIAERHPGRLRVIHGDALKADLRPSPTPEGRTLIIANLPYNIAAPLILGWLKTTPWPPWFHGVTVMVQREFADRLVATPERPKDYGRLSVITALRAAARIQFSVPPAAFTPQPKVMSSVVTLTPKPGDLAAPLALVERATAAAFGQRRKMLRQSLKVLGDAPALIEEADLAPDMRAEDVPPEGYLRLAQALARRAGDASGR